MGSRIHAVLIASALLACNGDDTPDMHVPRDMAAPIPFCNDSPDGGLAPTFANVQKLFTMNCTVLGSGCHTEESDHSFVNMDLTEGHAWASIVGVSTYEGDAGACGTRVVPHDAGASYLYQKLTEDTPCNGLGMPRCEDGYCPLPKCQIELIRAWIAAGAPQQ